MSWAFSCCVSSWLVVDLAQGVQLAAQALVLAAGGEQAADPVPGVAEGLDHLGDAGLEGLQDAGAGLLGTVQHAAGLLAEEQGEHGE